MMPPLLHPSSRFEHGEPLEVAYAQTSSAGRQQNGVEEQPYQGKPMTSMYSRGNIFDQYQENTQDHQAQDRQSKAEASNRAVQDLLQRLKSQRQHSLGEDKQMLGNALPNLQQQQPGCFDEPEELRQRIKQSEQKLAEIDLQYESRLKVLQQRKNELLQLKDLKQQTNMLQRQQENTQDQQAQDHQSKAEASNCIVQELLQRQHSLGEDTQILGNTIPNLQQHQPGGSNGPEVLGEQQV